MITATSRSPVRRSYKCGIVERWQFFLYLIIGGLSFIVEIALSLRSAGRRHRAPLLEVSDFLHPAVCRIEMSPLCQTRKNFRGVGGDGLSDDAPALLLTDQPLIILRRCRMTAGE